MKRKKRRTRSAKRKLIRVHFVMHLMRFCEPFCRRGWCRWQPKLWRQKGFCPLCPHCPGYRGIPPTEFCENLQEPPCRSAGGKVPEIISPIHRLKYAVLVLQYNELMRQETIVISHVNVLLLFYLERRTFFILSLTSLKVIFAA